jgi:predicted nucleic acid-binding protein
LAVLDTNAVLDWRLFRDEQAQPLWQALDDGRLCWLATQPMIDELLSVLRRPLGGRWDGPRERLLTDPGLASARLIDPAAARGHDLRCADPDDQKFIDLALHQNVQWLFTRDRALLALQRGAARLGVAIVQPRHWSGAAEHGRDEGVGR